MTSLSRDAALAKLRQAAAACTACDLYKRATQTVFGEGNSRAAIVLLGEQPGHEEDLAGRPFVGPAGRLLDEALPVAENDLAIGRLVETISKSRVWKESAIFIVEDDAQDGEGRQHTRRACRFDPALWPRRLRRALQ